MIRVIVESPYRGDLEMNLRYLVEPRITGVDIFATSATWAMMGAYNLAHAYRPEGVP